MWAARFRSSRLDRWRYRRSQNRSSSNAPCRASRKCSTRTWTSTARLQRQWPAGGEGEAPTGPPPSNAAGAQPPLPPGATLHRSAHYHITSATTPEATAQAADALESVRGMFLALFGVAAPEVAKPLRVVLYRDRTQFKAHNRSHAWAEAYYLPPVCHAWLDDEPNRFHWLTHEATHQLARELAGFPRKRWLDEGIASYVGAAEPQGGPFAIGSADRHAGTGGVAVEDVFIAVVGRTAWDGEDLTERQGLHAVRDCGSLDLSGRLIGQCSRRDRAQVDAQDWRLLEG